MADTIKIYVNGSDNEDKESNLTCQVQFKEPSGTWTDLDDEAFVTNHWEANFTPSEDAERGFHDFQVRFTDNDGAFSTWFEVLDVVEVLSEIPLVINISYSSTYVYRVDSIKIFTNGSDVEDDESDLTPIFEYKSPNGNWVRNWISNISYNSGTEHWEANFTASNDTELGFYDFRVKFIDKNNNESSWLEDLGKVEILNIIPIIVDISYSKNSIFRTDSIKIYVNGSDIEDAESKLDCQIQYRANPGTWKELTTKFVTDYWEATLFTDENAKLGFYDFRVNFIDSENASSGWFEDLDVLKVLNNIPSVINISYSAISVYRTESIKIYANGSDIENLESELDCQIQYKSSSGTWNDLIDIIFDTNNWEVVFSPDENAELGFYDFCVNFSDKDNAHSSWFEDLEGLEIINNLPVVVDISYSEISVYRTESIKIYINGSDMENVESQLDCQIQYKSPSGKWNDLNDIKFDLNSWEVVFSPDEDSEIGFYDFRVKFKDKDNAFSGWLEKFEQVEVNIKIFNKEPSAVIDKITPNSAKENEEVWFYGNGTDVDGTILNYQWSSSIDGFLSSEKSFSYSDLSKGTHIISFKVKDDKDIWSEVVTEFLEIRENRIPIAKITSPVEGEEFYENEMINFDGAKSSDEDNDKLTFLWTLNDKHKSIENKFVTELDNANYNIVLKVDDGKGGVARAQVNISVIKILEPPISFDENVITIEGTPIVDKEIWIKVKIHNPSIFYGNATIKFYCDMIDNDHLIANEQISLRALKDSTITTPWIPKKGGTCSIIVIIENIEPNELTIKNNKAQKSIEVREKSKVEEGFVSKNPVLIVGIGLAAFLSLYIGGTEIGRYKFLSLFLLPLYMRLNKDDKEEILDNFVRGEIFAAIKITPGIHYRGIMKQLDVKNGVLSYHLGVLEKTGLIKSRNERGLYKTFFPSGVKFPQEEGFRLTETQIEIINTIKENPGISQKEISSRVGLKQQIVNYNIRTLERAKKLEVNRKHGKSYCYDMDHPTIQSVE